MLEGFYCSQGTDSWKWRSEENGLLWVNPTYILLEKLMVWEERWGEVEKKVFRYLWKGQAPTRVVAFTLKLLLDHVPTRTNLAIRNIIPLDASMNCALWEMEV